MERSGPINVGVVSRGTKLKELWREAKCIMAGVKSSCWRVLAGVGGCSRSLHGSAAQTMIDTRCNRWED